MGTTVGTKERIEEVWSDLSLDFNLLEQIYKIGNFHGEHLNMVEFLGITFGHWTKVREIDSFFLQINYNNRHICNLILLIVVSILG